ncbi:glycosyltransferase family 9 protein [Candidatus Pelagibacter sp.]|nr:glycosyltransferase family 9 protein [Candidatus Pelagibacter sp.]
MKILAIQNRMGIGDMVIFLPYIEAVAKKYNSQVTLLVKENSKAEHLIKDNKYINEIIILKRDQTKKSFHDGLNGFFRLVSDIKKYQFDKVLIFNSSLRYRLVCRFAGINDIYQYPLFEKKNQHIVDAADNLLKNKFNLEIKSDPVINIKDENIQNIRAKFNFDDDFKNILLGIGGSGPTKRIPSKIFIEFMNLCLKNFKCRFFLATGNKNEEIEIMNEIVNYHKNICTPLNELSISETLPVIKNCNIAVCNDSSFSHLSAGLGKPTIVLMSDTPLIYGSYSSKMYPIMPDGVEKVTHGTEGKEQINPLKIFEKFQSLVN